MTLLANYNRAPVTFVKGEGCELIDRSGRRYLDMIGGIAVCALGHSHEAIAHAVAEQARTLVHCSNLFGFEPSETLARELCARSGFDRVFFCNSGTEANEAAIKLARKFAYRRGERDRATILSCSGGFHGRTLGSLAATPNETYQEGFGPMPAEFGVTPFNDVPALASAMNDGVAALIVEPVQGESGVMVADVAFLQAARDLCSKHGALLIFDEIQCGMGRLGPLFAFQRFGVAPDVVTMAKALANGLPIGAMLVRETFADGLRPGDHGSTFGGSPVPCAAALAHLRVRDEMHLERHVNVVSAVLFDALRQLADERPDIFGQPRGLGLLAGLPVIPPADAAAIVDRARTDSLVLMNRAGGNTIRFAPPLTVTEAQIARAVRALRDAAPKAPPNRSAKNSPSCVESEPLRSTHS
ncbi:MAG TPA: acetylornithine/succinylornithine family transaminase [Candidatus Baltobacteraceae bacterium]|nr:acetylornithine/succinylornithine family transaminase [Candidatus Baltobacteraceae bacterium]